MPTKIEPWHTVRRSPLHGNGVFAARDIPVGTRIIEYIGVHITPEQADERHPVNPDDPFHTFYFALSGGMVIDGGNGGNDARWVNHSCVPNCETEENTDGTRVYVVALRNIARDEELFYDYGLVLDDKITKKLKTEYRCLCGHDSCRGTMLALPEKKNKAKNKKTDDKSGKKDKKEAKTKQDAKSGRRAKKDAKRQEAKAEAGRDKAKRKKAKTERKSARSGDASGKKK